VNLPGSAKIEAMFEFTLPEYEGVKVFDVEYSENGLVKTSKSFSKEVNNGAVSVCYGAGDEVKSPIECCEGLVPLHDGTMDETNACLREYDLLCLNCGDGVCGGRENKCNCPEDCPVEEYLSEDKPRFPICGAIGTKSEGWYLKGELIKYDTCSKCSSICDSIGTKSEGWYSSCDYTEDSLIKYELCYEIELPEEEVDEGNETVEEEVPTCSQEGEVAGECCEGLSSVPNAHPDANNPGLCLHMDHRVCVNCGDGVCGTGENKCNCPKDCSISDYICPTVCTHLWKIDSTGKACTDDFCGSGCGADGKTTFDTKEKCEAGLPSSGGSGGGGNGSSQQPPSSGGGGSSNGTSLCVDDLDCENFCDEGVLFEDGKCNGNGICSYHMLINAKACEEEPVEEEIDEEEPVGEVEEPELARRLSHSS